MAQIRHPTVGFITYKEVPPSPHENYVNNQLTVTRVFDCDWGMRWPLVQAMLGWSQFVTDPNGVNYVTRNNPAAYDQVFNLRGEEWLFATTLQSVEGRGTTADFRQYVTARVSIGYEAVSYKILDDTQVQGVPVNNISFPDETTLQRYITRQLQPTAEALILPRGGFKWVDDAIPGNRTIVPNTNTKIVPSSEVVYTWHQVPGIPEAARSLLGCVNNNVFDTFLANSEGYAIGTLLLTGVDVKPMRNIVGVKVYDLVYKMKYFAAVDPTTQGLVYAPARGHNYFLRLRGSANALVYQLVSRDGTSATETVFTPADFTKLFKGPFIREPHEL